MSNHTPGPWGVSSTGTDVLARLTRAGGQVIAVMRPHAEAEANACLMAAAPDLLEAARLFVKRHAQVPAVPVDPAWPANGDTDCVCGDCSRFKPAIAKAEGRQP